MSWFKHDTHAFADPRMVLFRAKFGLEGVGFYWTMMELLAESPDGELLEANALLMSKHLLQLDEQRASMLLRGCFDARLLCYGNNANTYCCQRLKEERKDYADKVATRRAAGRKGGKVSGVTRQANASKQNEANASTVSEAKRSDKIRLDKIRLDKSIKIPPTPHWGELHESLEQWCAYRQAAKKKLSDFSIRQILKNYEGDPQRLKRDVENSIANGYTGLFPPSILNGNHQPKLTHAQEMLKLAAELEEQNL